MSAKLRLIIVILITLGILGLAGNQVAWAGFSHTTQPGAAAAPDNPSISNKGTVRPPNCGNTLTITKSGRYSLCGVAIIKANYNTEDDVQYLVSLGPTAPKETDAGKVRAGPVVFSSLVNGAVYTGPYDAYAAIKLCFAAHPEKKVLIKFYDAALLTWVALPTSVDDGQACATVNSSGQYVLVKK